MTETKISRQHLYDLIWNQPMTKVAEQLDTPYERLLRACVETDIPKPTTGHWAKVAHGAPLPERPPLTGDPDASLWLPTGVNERNSKDERHQSLAREFLNFDGARVYSQLRQPHSAVKQMLEWSEVNEGRIDSTTNRVLRISDCIAKALTRESFEVTAASYGVLKIRWREGETIFHLKEKLIRPRDPQGKVVRKGDLVRTGKLYSVSPSRVEETEISELENMIPQILRNIATACAAKDEEEKERRKRQLNVAVRRAELLAEREKSGRKHNAIAKFIIASDEWHRIQRAKSFLATVEGLPRTTTPFLEQDSTEWISHLRAKLDEHDPLKDGLDGLLSKITS